MFAQGASGARSQIKARIFEVTGMGGCLLTEMAEGLEDYFRLGVEVETFSTPEELVLKVRRLLSDPMHRDAVARAGNIRTSTEHTYENRFRELLTVADRLAEQRKIDPARLDWSKFERAVARHRTGRVAVGVAVGLRKLCSIFWGPARGARAARRATYELSWRLARAQTYSAAGWPGRLFYRES
jgi:spore maturation protein CgeB